jgi:hypothetical protein
MTVSIKGKLLSLYRAPDFKDRETGEVLSVGKHKLQLLVETKLSNGSVKHDMQDISIPDVQVKEYENQVGKDISVECSFMSKSPVSFYMS